MTEYIEREKLLKSLKGSEKKLHELYETARGQDMEKSCYGQLIMLTECILRIKEQPAAEVEPVRHAKWEANKSGYLACTNCAWERRWIPLVEHYPRCPNCGAWMDGGAENG